jgi:hypothetical protein
MERQRPVVDGDDGIAKTLEGVHAEPAHAGIVLDYENALRAHRRPFCCARRSRPIRPSMPSFS